MTTDMGNVRGAMRSPDFRRLLGMRLVSQTADGFIQAALVASLAFSPDRATTAAGFAAASAILVIPFSVIGPFTGVFIDRWSRRSIMIASPLLRAAPVFLVLLDPGDHAVWFYAGALWVTSVNRFFLATAQAVVPRLVPTEDLLSANSVATVGGTVALLTGVFIGGLASENVGNGVIVTAASLAWLITAAIAASIRSDLRPHQLPEDPELLRHRVRRLGTEFAEGLSHIVHTPRAIGPITTISVDQVGQGLVLVLAIVVFRERFGQGVGSFSWLIAAGGVGVFIGLATVGRLSRRYSRQAIVAGAFVAGGITLLLVAVFVDRWSVMLASFAIGLTFAWKKIPIDTMVQEAVPDGVRGRVFAVYDVIYNLSRLSAAFLAIVLIPALGESGSAALIGIVFIAWAPVLPRWLRHAPEIRLRFSADDPLRPTSVRWGAVEEAVTSATARGDGGVPAYRLGLADGTTIDVSRTGPDGGWEIDREVPDLPEPTA
jgi:MFS family permease